MNEKVLKSCPITESQMGVYLECINAPDTVKYNLSFLLCYPAERVDPERMARAFDAVTRHYSAFSTVVRTVEGKPMLQVLDTELPEIGIEEMEDEYVDAYKESFAMPFSLDEGILWQAKIISTPERTGIIMSIHHMIFDGTSIMFFEHALSEAYAGRPLPAEDDGMFEISGEEAARRGDAHYNESLAHFEGYLKNPEAESAILPDLAVVERDKYTALVNRDMNLDVDAVERFTRANGINPNVLLLGGFAYTLAKFNGQKDVQFNSVESGRRGRNLKNSMGMFVRTFPLYVCPDEEKRADEYLRDLRAEYIAAMQHDDVPFAELVNRFGIKSEVTYAYQNNLQEGVPVDGQPGRLELIDNEAVSPLAAMLFRNKTGYSLSIHYRQAMYTRELMEQLAEMYMCVVRGMLENRRLRDIELVSESARKCIDAANATEKPYDRRETIGRLFAAVAAKAPDSGAVRYKDRRYTYGQLDRMTRGLAGFIHEKGIGREDFVAILIPRNEYMPITAMGVLRAGAAYQPLDPTYPVERLNFMVQDSGTRLLIADRGLRHLLTEYTGDVLYTDEIPALEDPGKVNYMEAPESAAVLIYTSGTTGVPKGCIIENRNIVALWHGHRELYDLNAGARVAQYASFGFDACVLDIFTTLLTGAELCIIPDEIRLDLSQIEKFFCENGITHCAMTTQVGRMLAEKTKCPTLRYLGFGGEKLVPFKPQDTFICKNLYGPSEATVYITGYTIRDNSAMQPIGTAVANTKLYITDAFGRMLPPGACGELCASGLQVARGYHNRPKKTAEVFIPNPFDRQEGYDRLYRTGDVVRMLPDGNYEFVGRRDGQVKIRGFRVELTEVEQVIRECPGVINATVQAYSDPNEGKFIAAFYTSYGPLNPDRINDYIAQRKPPYMVPAVTMQIDAIPLNPNGKVDKRKLPRPERKFEDVREPETAMQRVLFDMVSKITGTQRFGIDTDLYLAGLNSIGSISLCSQLGELFGVPVQIRDLKKHATVEALEKFIQESRGTGAARHMEETDRRPVPLTKTQEGIFVECAARPDSTVYNIPYLLKLGEGIDPARLKQAVVRTVQAHSYLLTELYTDAEGVVCQRLPENAAFGEADIPEIRAERLEDVRDGLVTPFALTGGRLFAISLIYADGLYLFINVHHIIADGTSMTILLRDIESAYVGELVPRETYTGFDVARTEQKARAGEDYAAAKSYYEKLLEDLDKDFMPLPDKYRDDPADSGRIAEDAELADTAEIRAFCDRNGLSLNGFFCGVFGFVLAKYAGTEYSVYNTIYNGRNDSRTASTVSMLVKTLPVVCRIDAQSPAELLRGMSAQLMDSMTNDLYSYAEISRDLGVRSDVMFIYQGEGFGRNSFCGEAAEQIDMSLSDAKTPISLQVTIRNGRVFYDFEYDPRRYTRRLAAAFLSAYDKALSEFVRKDELCRVSLLTEAAERDMERYNGGTFAYDESKTISDLFLENVRTRPEHLCVAYKDVRLTYGQVGDITGRIAAFLAGQGIGTGDVVAILIHRDENMVLSAHGAVRTGAAYLGLDPTYPTERLQFMIDDSGAKYLIADRRLMHLIPEYAGRVLYTDEFAQLPEMAPGALAGEHNRVTPENDALLVYSSGTTGLPKGTVLRQKNILCFFHNYRRAAYMDSNANVATYASFGFDGGAQDVFSAPMAGAALFVIPDEIRMDLNRLEEFYGKHSITSGFMTTQVGTLFIGATKCRSLRTFMVGGEKLIPVVGPDWVDFYNGYGPSETMCYVNLFRVRSTESLQPVGIVSDNVREYIIDRFGNRLPYGACGEMCIAGGQTGRGYINRPEKTAEVFVKNPFCAEVPYDVMYKTGDVMRMLPDGNYDFVGRRDGQVKIRGFRVELAEIEQQIRLFDGIRNAAVVALDNPSGGKYLAAYVEADAPVDMDELKAFIASVKPDYMVPAAIMQIDKIPLTSNGKLDKKRLPKPETKSRRKGARPADETEQKLCEIFAEVLGMEDVFADDDFFAIGGTSISAIRVVVKCEQAGYDVVFKNLFANPTPQMLAAFIHGKREKSVCASELNAENQFDDSALRYNVVENLKDIRNDGVGNVLLTGVTGFLGSHVFRELMHSTTGNVICLVRGKEGLSARQRFEMIMAYYFESWYSPELARRTTIIDGALEDEDLMDKLQGHPFDTILNCAANVKHFAVGDELLRANFSGVERMIALAESTGARLVQISTISVSGESINGSVPQDFIFRENNLNVGQTLENKYIYSKYMAEQAVIDAVSRGRIRGKIIRLGNLMARAEDSEFQINADTNGFMRTFRGFEKLGCYPISGMDTPVEFSPIDSVARAVVLLSGTPDGFCVFHAQNCNSIQYGYFLLAMRKEGVPIELVEDAEFAARLTKALSEGDAADYAGLLAYKNSASQATNDSAGEGEVRTMVRSDTTFTTKALYRLGFAWPLIDNRYLENMVKGLRELFFFD